MNNNTLELTIKAVDEASKELDKVQASLKDLGGGVDGANKQLKDFGDTQVKAGQGSESMAGAVFKGGLALEAVKKGLEIAIDFTKQSVEAYLEAEKTMARVRASVASMGKSYEEVGPQIEEFGAKMARLGVDDEAAMESMTRLAKVAGGDLKQGMDLAKMAADLTASGFGTLESNTDNLEKVMTGKGSRALMEYRINLSDTATTAEQLDAIHKKITQTTEDYANTVPGKIDIVKTAYGNLQETVGQGFVEAFASAIDTGTNFDDALEGINTTATYLKYTIFEVVQGVTLMIQGFKNGINTMQIMGDSVLAVTEKLWGGTKASESLASNLDDAEKNGKNIADTFTKMLNPTQAMEEAHKKVSEAAKQNAASHTSLGFAVKNANDSAIASHKQHEDALGKLKDGYTKLKSDTATSLAEMTGSFVSNMSTISDSIAKTQRAISDLQKAYNQNATSDTASIADKIIASEQKVKDFKTQIAAETDAKKRADLQKQLDAEQKNLDSSADFQKDNQTAITEAKRRAGLTQLQRDIEDYKTRRAMATEEFIQKSADLQADLNAQLAKQAAEFNLYNAKVAKIKEMEAAATADYIDNSKARLKQTTDEVNQAISLYQQLLASINAAKSASASSLGTISSPVSGKRALGGNVSGGSTYLVGENGPELFTAPGSGSIVPTNKIGGSGGQNIVINVTGTFLSETAAREVGNMIIKNFKTMSRVGA